MKTISDQLRQSIVKSRLTHYRIGKDAGVSPSVIDRFVSGERTITMETADRLCEALGLELVQRSKRKK